MWKLHLLAVLLLPQHLATEPAPDLVERKDGRSLEGIVVYEDDEQLVLRVKSVEKEVPQGEIASVRAALRELPKALEEIGKLGRTDVRSHLLVAADLEKRNLPLEARLAYWRVLLVDPDNEPANLALGHRKRQKSWVSEHEGHWWKLDELQRRRQADFGDAWELSTTHYLVRTDLPLAQAIDCALDLERLFLGFYRAFGPGMQLRAVTERMTASIHATTSSYPQIGGGRGGYYVPSEGTLYLNAAGGLDRTTLVHEGTHQLVDYSARRMRPGKGKIPGWLDEGLAQYMEAAMTGKPGELVIVPGRLDLRRFATHGGDEDPYGLNRVLNFQSDDFGASSKVHLKYAQSYTLVSFCLHGDAGAYRDGFFEFLKSAYAGKSSSTHFKKAIGVKERELEKAWAAYVKRGGK